MFWTLYFVLVFPITCLLIEPINLPVKLLDLSKLFTVVAIVFTSSFFICRSLGRVHYYCCMLSIIGATFILSVFWNGHCCVDAARSAEQHDQKMCLLAAL